jgi:hypothetical protein
MELFKIISDFDKLMLKKNKYNVNNHEQFGVEMRNELYLINAKEYETRFNEYFDEYVRTKIDPEVYDLFDGVELVDVFKQYCNERYMHHFESYLHNIGGQEVDESTNPMARYEIVWD